MADKAAATAELLVAIHTEFPARRKDLTDDYIEQNPDPFRVELSNDWNVILPAYMSWCVRSPLRNTLLVLDHTVNALAIFGRTSEAQNSTLDFRSRCSGRQCAVIVAFLRWCQSGAVVVHDEQVKRSLRRWLQG